MSNSNHALVIGHPGHELRVFGWIEATRPQVFVLTDGSGSSAKSRTSSTDSLLQSLGATRGSIYARFTDVFLYQSIMDHKFTVFTALADELASALTRSGVQMVAGDAAEGYNPVHDACRMLIDTAVSMARKASGPIENVEFTLVGPPDECPVEVRSAAHWLRLPDDVFERKLSAARRYPELATEVEAALTDYSSPTGLMSPDLVARSGMFRDSTHGNSFRLECLRPAGSKVRNKIEERPFYEIYGEQKVASGQFKRVLRYREHMVPLAEALRDHAQLRSQ
jgi:hypothetical protein